MDNRQIEQIGFSDLHGSVPERYAARPYGVTLVFRLCSVVVDEVEVRSKPTFTYFQHYRAVNAAQMCIRDSAGYAQILRLTALYCALF